jgi:hypothetical protein
MNYIADRVINQELQKQPSETKFVALVGANHCHPPHAVPSLVHAPWVKLLDRKSLSLWDRLSKYQRDINFAVDDPSQKDRKIELLVLR